MSPYKFPFQKNISVIPNCNFGETFVPRSTTFSCYKLCKRLLILVFQSALMSYIGFGYLLLPTPDRPAVGLGSGRHGAILFSLCVELTSIFLLHVCFGSSWLLLLRVRAEFWLLRIAVGLTQFFKIMSEIFIQVKNLYINKTFKMDTLGKRTPLFCELFLNSYHLYICPLIPVHSGISQSMPS